MRSILIFLLFLGSYVESTATVLDSLRPRIADFPRHIHLYSKIGPSYSHVDIENPNIDETLLFKPNPQSVVGLGFSYSWLGLGINFLLPANELSIKKYGRTQKYDFEAHYTMSRLMVDLTLKSYRGFYFSNADDFISDWQQEDYYPQLPDLQTFSIATSFAYIFSPDKYSANAAYSFTKAMRRSGGSWMLGGYVSLNGVGSDSSIVPLIVKEHVDPKLDLKAIVFSNFGVSFGYSHLFTLWKKYFISFTLLPGISFQHVIQESTVNDSIKEYDIISMRNISRFSIGKNGDRVYWGVSTYVESTFVKESKTQLILNSGHTEIFLGYRINTSNWRFMKGIDRVMHPRFLRFITGQPPQRD